MAHEAILYCSDRRYGSDEIYSSTLKKVIELASIEDFSDIYPIRTLGASLSALDNNNLPFWQEQIETLKHAGIKKITLLEHLDCFYAKELLIKSNINYSTEEETKLHLQSIENFKKLLSQFHPEAELTAFWQFDTDIKQI